MKLKLIVLVLSALTTLSAVAATSSTPETHNLAVQKDSSGLFIGIHGGGAWLNSISFSPKGGTSPATIRVQYQNPGYDAYGNFGYYYHGFALDLTGGLIHGNNHRISGGTVAASPSRGYTKITFGMTDLSYMYDRFQHFLPYGGFGVGYAYMQHHLYNYSQTLQVESSDTRVAYQVFMGMGYAFNDHWLLGVDYHFMGTLQGHFRPKYQGVSYRSWQSSYVNLLNLGVSYLF